MDRWLLPILPLLALALMGSSCDFRASVNNPPPSSADDEKSPRSGDGLRVVIRSGDTIESTGEGGTGSAQALVAGALSMSTLTSPVYVGENGRAEDASVAGETTPQAAGVEASNAIAWVSVAPVPIALATTSPDARPASAVPEPGGLLLFACGVGLASAGLHRRASGAG